MRSKSGGAICTDTTIRLYHRRVKGPRRADRQRSSRGANLHRRIFTTELVNNGLPIYRASSAHAGPAGCDAQRDPMEAEMHPRPSTLRDRIAAQWFLEAPLRPGGERLVLDPLSLQPFPHPNGQIAVAP